MGLIIAIVLIWQRLNDLNSLVGGLRDELADMHARLHEATLAAPVVSDTAPADDEAREEAPARTIASAASPWEAAMPRRESESPDESIATPTDSEPDYATAEPADEGEPWEPAEPSSSSRTFDFEDIFGRKLPIWAGGIALAIAGIFLVRYSIEAGLLTPSVRVALSFGFGALLLALAETAYRFEARLGEPRVRQALSGAGLATLYAAFYLAGTQYGMIGSGAAFVGLAAVTAAAIGLAFRYGLSSAVLGLVGGFAAPALVASDEANVPVLTIYLAVIAAGLAWTGARIGKPWLGYIALLGGFGWGAVLLAADLVAAADLTALGLLFGVLGIGVPLLAGRGEAWRWPRLIAAGLASIQMALLIGMAGFEPLTWGLYLLLGAALAVLGWREPFLREAGAFTAALGLWLLAIWDAPSLGQYFTVAAGFAAIFIGSPLLLVLRGRAREVDIWQLIAVPAALVFVNRMHWGLWGDAVAFVRALPDLLLAVPLAAALLHQWRKRDIWQEELAMLASLALLLLLAAWVVAPLWAAPLAAAAIALGIAGVASLRDEDAFALLGFVFAGVAIACLPFGAAIIDEVGRAFGLAADPGHDPLRGMLRWAAVALPFAALAIVVGRASWRAAAEAMALLLSYVALAQVLPNAVIPASLAAVAVLLAWRLRQRDGGLAAALFLLVAWATIPFGQWAVEGAEAVLASPMMVDELPRLALVLQRFVPLLLAAALLLWLRRERWPGERAALGVLAVAIGLAGLHILYKQLFAIDSAADFVQHGLAERTIWQALLLAAGTGLLWRATRGPLRAAGGALIGIAFAHVVVFSLVLHNPLWADQAVGPWPIANLILPLYAIAIGAVLLLKRIESGQTPQLAVLADGAMMVLALGLALTELRHAFSGSYLTAAPLSQTEDLLRSVVGIALAIGFLLWGRATGQRDWRVGSLVLMLVAVGKVFLLDAAGLEGLLRIASFLALGVSLIGIGWLYSRQLRVGDEPAPASA